MRIGSILAQAFVRFFSRVVAAWHERNAPAKSSGTGIGRWLVALHRATVFGLPMKIVNCLMGLVTTALCVTGVIIWLKKREVSAAARACKSKLGSVE